MKEKKRGFPAIGSGSPLFFHNQWTIGVGSNCESVIAASSFFMRRFRFSLFRPNFTTAAFGPKPPIIGTAVDFFCSSMAVAWSPRTNALYTWTHCLGNRLQITHKYHKTDTLASMKVLDRFLQQMILRKPAGIEGA